MSITSSQNQRYFRTSNFYAAAFLYANDQTLVNIDKEPGRKRALFVFIDSPEREKLLQVFSFAKDDSPELKVDARKFVTAVKLLKDKLYQEF